MSLSKVKSGSNMYQDWITDTLSIIQGSCPHECQYCYVQKGFYTKNSPFYKGSPRLVNKDLEISWGEGKTIFVCHMSDMFADGIPSSFINAILEKCAKHPKNVYVFQSKNPKRILDFIDKIPKSSMIGTTIETDRMDILEKISKAPNPMDRAIAMERIRNIGYKTFITIEPIMKFNVSGLVELLAIAKPIWVNIGADSKNCGLTEPSWDDVQGLVQGIRDLGIEIKEKSNLERLKVI